MITEQTHAQLQELAMFFDGGWKGGALQGAGKPVVEEIQFKPRALALTQSPLLLSEVGQRQGQKGSNRGGPDYLSELLTVTCQLITATIILLTFPPMRLRLANRASGRAPGAGKAR